MQPLTTWYEYRNHSTKTKLKICFTFFLINKKKLAFMEKILFKLPWKYNYTAKNPCFLYLNKNRLTP
jgi:hypothetical protein